MREHSMLVCKASAARGCRGGCPHRRGARGGGRGRAQQQGRGARGPRWRRRAWVSQRLARCTPSKFLGQPGIGIWLIGITRDLPQHFHGGSRSGRGGGGEHLRAASRRTPATPLLPPLARGSSEPGSAVVRSEFPQGPQWFLLCIPEHMRTKIWHGSLKPRRFRTRHPHR